MDFRELFVILEEWMNSMSNVTIPGSNSSAVVRGLFPGTPYSFRLIAKNYVGYSPPSTGVGITTTEEGN